MKKLAVLMSLSIIFSATAAAQSPQNSGNTGPSFMPGDLFYPLESFVEDVEVMVAGVIGGSDFKAKALANNANETLRKAENLAENNRSEKASEMVEKYSRSLNRSKMLADESGDRELSEKIKNISGKNVQVLEKVRDKVPAQARKGIEKAINNSRKDQIPEKDKEQADKENNRPKLKAPKNRDNKQNLTKKLKDKTENLMRNSSEKSLERRPSMNESPEQDNPSENQNLDPETSDRGKNENPLAETGKGLLVP